MSDSPDRLSLSVEDLAVLLRKPSSEHEQDTKTMLSFDKLLFPLIVVAITALAGVVFTLSQEMASTKEKIVTLNDNIKDLKGVQIKSNESTQQVNVISQQITSLVSTSSAIQTNIDKIRADIQTDQQRTSEKFSRFESTYLTQSDFKTWAEDFKADVKSSLGDMRARVDRLDKP